MLSMKIPGTHHPYSCPGKGICREVRQIVLFEKVFFQLIHQTLEDSMSGSPPSCLAAILGTSCAASTSSFLRLCGWRTMDCLVWAISQEKYLWRTSPSGCHRPLLPLLFDLSLQGFHDNNSFYFTSFRNLSFSPSIMP